MNEWISVGERLPEKDGKGKNSIEVLAFNGCYFPARVCFESNNDWFETIEYEPIYKITHWMPLPEPPK